MTDEREQIARKLYELNKIQDWDWQDAPKHIKKIYYDLADGIAPIIEQAAVGAVLHSIKPYVVFPELPHKGSCGPEAGCDGNCVDAARLAETFQKAQTALREYVERAVSKATEHLRISGTWLAHNLHEARGHTEPFEKCDIQFCAEFQQDPWPTLSQKRDAQIAERAVRLATLEHEQIQSMGTWVCRCGKWSIVSERGPWDEHVLDAVRKEMGL